LGEGFATGDVGRSPTSLPDGVTPRRPTLGRLVDGRDLWGWGAAKSNDPLLTSSACGRPASAAAEPFALGILVGSPMGISARLALGRPLALGLAVGAASIGDGGPDVHLDALWHPVLLAESDRFDLPIYVGLGGRVMSAETKHQGNDLHVGVRVPVGLLAELRPAQLQIFAEVAASPMSSRRTTASSTSMSAAAYATRSEFWRRCARIFHSASPAPRNRANSVPRALGTRIATDSSGGAWRGMPIQRAPIGGGGRSSSLGSAAARLACGWAARLSSPGHASRRRTFSPRRRSSRARRRST